MMETENFEDINILKKRQKWHLELIIHYICEKRCKNRCVCMCDTSIYIIIKLNQIELQ